MLLKARLVREGAVPMQPQQIPGGSGPWPAFYSFLRCSMIVSVTFWEERLREV